MRFPEDFKIETESRQRSIALQKQVLQELKQILKEEANGNPTFIEYNNRILAILNHRFSDWLSSR